MKRIICAVIGILVIIIVFAGCNQKYDFSAQYIQIGQVSEMDELNSVAVIGSSKELEDYCPDIDQYTSTVDDGISFKEAMGKYDTSFFKEKLLAIVWLKEGSGSIRHRVSSVVNNEDIIEINIKRKTSRLQMTDDEAEWHIIIELNKTEFPGETKFSVNVV